MSSSKSVLTLFHIQNIDKIIPDKPSLALYNRVYRHYHNLVSNTASPHSSARRVHGNFWGAALSGANQPTVGAVHWVPSVGGSWSPAPGPPLLWSWQKHPSTSQPPILEQKNVSKEKVASNVHPTSILILTQAWQFFKFFTVFLALHCVSKKSVSELLGLTLLKMELFSNTFLMKIRYNSHKIYFKRYNLGNGNSRYEANHLT